MRMGTAKAVLLRMTTNLVAGIKQTHGYQRGVIVLPGRVLSAAGHTSWSDVTEQTLASDLAQLIKNCAAVRPCSVLSHQFHETPRR